MSNTKHTLGPWNAECCIVRDKTRQIRIAKCDESWQLDWREMEANAHLIAAAPDLLAALKSAEVALAAYASTRVGVHHLALETARAAIAKAEANQ